MAKLSFHDLSVDIKALIIDRITRPSDLKNVCLVNKQLHELAVKNLYRNVQLDLGGPNDNYLPAFLSPKNIGLKYIRQLRLYLADIRDKCNQDQQAEFAGRMILEFLPEDVLEEFSWCPWKPFSLNNLLLLYKKQRKMKWVEVMELDRPILAELEKNEHLYKDLVQNTRKLALYPESRETLRLSNFFIKKITPVLEEMIVHANFPDSPTRVAFIEPRELNDTATGPGLLTRTMFEHLLHFETCSPLASLKSLRLHKINLRYCDESWCKIIDFQNVEQLRVYECPGADSLFGQLSKASNLPKKLKILEFQHRDNAENEALLALDGFLCLVSGLRDLIVDLTRVKALPAAAGIARHSKTLEVLSVHCSLECMLSSPSSTPEDLEELVYNLDDFTKICQACTHLEQLSFAFPPASLIRAPNVEWHAFENQLSHLTGLVTLHVSTFPNTKPSTTLLPRTVYEQLLQGLAQRIFENMSTRIARFHALHREAQAKGVEVESRLLAQRQSKLRLVAFGISDKIYEREDSKQLLIYLQSTSQDAEGKAQAFATPIGWCLRQYVEPRSEVLDFALHREARAPCRDYSSGGALGWADDDDDDESVIDLG